MTLLATQYLCAPWKLFWNVKDNICCIKVSIEMTTEVCHKTDLIHGHTVNETFIVTS